MTTRIVILAAGKGTRMKAELPKVLMPLQGKPMIEHVLSAVEAAGVDPKPLIVIGSGGELVRKTLGEKYAYVVQEPQLGTGHAVGVAMEKLQGTSDAILVLYGDQPFIKARTISRLARTHEHERPVLTMMTTTVQDFEEWRRPLYDFGRIIRNQQGEIKSIIEKKDATEKELAIRELNPAFFCFSGEWLADHLPKLTQHNTQKEYYLTDLVGIAIQEGGKIASLDVSPLESIGVNTREHLEAIHTLD